MKGLKVFGLLTIIGIFLVSGCLSQRSGECKGCLKGNITLKTEFVENSGENLYFINRSSGSKELVNENPVHITAFDNYKNKVVWVSDRNLNYSGNIYLKNMKTGEEKKLLSRDVEELGLYKNKIVFLTREDINEFQLYLYDLEGKEARKLTEEPALMGCLGMEDHNVVFKRRGDSPGIYLIDLKNLKAGREKVADVEISPTLRPIKNCPVISGEKVIYGEGDEHTTTKLYLYNVTSEETKEIAEIKTPFILGEIYDVEVSGIRACDNRIRYKRTAQGWIGPDISHDFERGFEVNLSSGEKTLCGRKESELQEEFKVWRSWFSYLLIPSLERNKGYSIFPFSSTLLPRF